MRSLVAYRLLQVAASVVLATLAGPVRRVARVQVEPAGLDRSGAVVVAS